MHLRHLRRLRFLSQTLPANIVASRSITLYMSRFPAKLPKSMHLCSLFAMLSRNWLSPIFQKENGGDLNEASVL